MREEKIIITYSSFKSLTKVCERFGCIIKSENFVKEKEFICNNALKQNILEDFNDSKNFKNEYSICETVIRPILSLPSKANKLPLWSHSKLEVIIDENTQFSGEPDYLWGIPTVEGGDEFSNTVASLCEAKKDDFSRGWAQVGAEMVAAQIKNNNKEIPIFGLVTNGNLWQFGKLEGEVFIIDKRSFTAPGHLDEVFNVLNWFFCEARKNADILASFISSPKIR